jgi:hypothetical protein
MIRPTRIATPVALGVLAVALLLVALPGWLGWRAEKTYRALLDEFATTTGATTTVRHYDRGWLHSEAESEIHLGTMALVVRLHLDHGPLALDGFAPIMARVRGELHPIESVGAAAVAPLTLDGATDLRGATRLTIAWPAGRLLFADGTLEWLPWRGRIAIEPAARRLQMQLEAPGIHFAGEAGGSWRLEAPRLHADLHEGIGGFPLGDISASAARLVYPPYAVIDGGRVSAAARLNGDGVTLAFGARLQSWNHDAGSIGPGELALEARRLEPAALLPLLRALPALSRPAETATAAAMLAPLAALLARKAPEAEIVTLRLQHASGELTGRGRLRFDGRRLGANVAAGRLLTALGGEAELTLPASLVRAWLAPETEGHIADSDLSQHLVEHPFARLLAPVETGYRLTATLKHGQLLINDKPWQCTGMFECRERAGARSDHGSPAALAGP